MQRSLGGSVKPTELAFSFSLISFEILWFQRLCDDCIWLTMLSRLMKIVIDSFDVLRNKMLDEMIT